MTDREALTAALEEFGEFPPPEEQTDAAIEVMLRAARERLAQLPEKCEHGESEPHPMTGPSICLGNVYPAELVERIAATICRIDNATGPDVAVEGIPCDIHRSVAVAVLDALNGES